MPTASEIKRQFHRRVREYAATHGTPIWRLSSDEWGCANLAAAERLAQHILDLADDDPRFATIAQVYADRGWGADRFPTGILAGWLAHVGASGGSGIPNDPDEFVTAWRDAERYSVARLGG